MSHRLSDEQTGLEEVVRRKDVVGERVVDWELMTKLQEVSRRG